MGTRLRESGERRTSSVCGDSGERLRGYATPLTIKAWRERRISSLSSLGISLPITIACAPGWHGGKTRTGEEEDRSMRIPPDSPLRAKRTSWARTSSLSLSWIAGRPAGVPVGGVRALLEGGGADWGNGRMVRG